jgi:hypothetical protein
LLQARGEAVQLRQTGDDVLVDRLGGLSAVDGEHPFPARVVLEQGHGPVEVHLQAVLDNGLGVVRAPSTPQQPAHELLAGDVEVHRRLHLRPQRLGHGEGRLGLLDGPGEPVEDIAAGLGRGDDGLAEHVHNDAVRDQVAVVDVLLGFLPQRRLVPDVLTQQVTAGDMRDAEPPGQQLGLGSLAGARGTDQQQSHLITGPAARPAARRRAA